MTNLIELGGGLFVESSESLKQQQIIWNDEDPCKNMDFNEYPFWLTTDSGDIPEGFNSIKEMMEHLIHGQCLTESQIELFHALIRMYES